MKRGTAQTYIWALPQVARDGFTYFQIGDESEDDVQPFDDVIFPIDIGREAEGDGGIFDQCRDDAVGARTAQYRSGPTRGWPMMLAPGVRSEGELGVLIDFFRARRGAAIAFRFADPFDDSSNGMNGVPTMLDQHLGVGDGVRTSFALVKNYGRCRRKSAGSRDRAWHCCRGGERRRRDRLDACRKWRHFVRNRPCERRNRYRRVPLRCAGALCRGPDLKAAARPLLRATCRACRLSKCGMRHEGQLACRTRYLVAYGWRLERRDGVTLGFTSHDRDIDHDGLLLRASPGMKPTTIVSSLGLDNDGLDVRGALTADAIRGEDLVAGRWDAAYLEIFLFDWADPGAGRRLLASGELGAVSFSGDVFKAEFLGLKRVLDRAVVPQTSPSCRASFCDAACGLNRRRFRHLATVQGADGNRLLLDTPNSVVANGFAYGSIRWLDGPNCGLVSDVWASDASRRDFAESTRRHNRDRITGRIDRRMRQADNNLRNPICQRDQFSRRTLSSGQ